jgi:hypothetical protein
MKALHRRQPDPAREALSVPFVPDWCGAVSLNGVFFGEGLICFRK